MTTPKPPPSNPPKAPSEKPRVTRPSAARTGPNRTFAAGPAGPAPTAPPAETPSGAPLSPDEAIARAVRLGYGVIGENIEQGREAASRFRAGAYSVREVPQDLNRLALRLLHLTRELSTTTFDVLDRLIQDPAFPGAAARSTPATGGPASTQGDYTPPKFYAGQTPSAPPAAPAQQTAETKVASADAPGGAPPPAAVSTSIDLTCQFTEGRGVVKAAALARPETPMALVLKALNPAKGTAAPITGLTFCASADKRGISVRVPIPAAQPAGIYTGVISEEDTGLALGVLTIEVLA